jgi:hypothetical protein
LWSFRTFTQIRPVWVVELEISQKLQQINGWGLIFLLANFVLVMLEIALEKVFCLATSKKKLFYIASILTSIGLGRFLIF